jgi:uncharacterized protein YbjT (DUF2867 family)
MYLVTGATGNVGREVVSLLLAEGAKVRAQTRNPDAFLPADAEPVVANLSEDPRQAADALDGVTGIFLHSDALGQKTEEFLALARERGVQRVILLSSGYVRDGVPAAEQPGFVAMRHKTEEDIVEASGLEWTALRPDDYASNVKFGWVPQLLIRDVLHSPYADAASAVIHERDIAAVAVRALLDDGHHGARYLLSGPEVLTERDRLRIIGEVLGRPLRFEELAPDDAKAAWVAHGMPSDVADSVLSDLAEATEHPHPLTDVVPHVTGRPALSFAQWVAEHTDLFAA